MNDNNRTALIAITEGMVDAGMEVLEQYLNQTDAETEEGPSDTAMVTALFTRMWQVHMAEIEAVKRGKQPKILMPVRNSLVMPTPKRH